ncbi:MAG: TonB-dependent receptor, partial [Proteobacteria bacterium]|nr:TonB-dependent receptor [Pseudomonadota bacterium]
MSAVSLLKPMCFSVLFFVFAIGLNTSTWADEEEGKSDRDHVDEYHAHGDIEEVIVTASPLGRTRFDILQSTASLSGDKLEEDLGGNIGETLDHLPGISNSYFGPGAGRPIIRGLGGDRIRILIGGIGSLDASSTSPDHAVGGDVLTAQTIEVIRGPATLLYGNNAVGGVINIIDGRIPFELPENTFSSLSRVLYGTNGDDFSIATAFDLKASDAWAFHAEGSFRNAGDITVPGYLRTAALRQNSPPAPGELEPFKTAPNTSLETTNISVGVSHFFKGGFAGMAISRLDSNYGIPLIPGFGEEEAIRIDLKQTRFDFMSEIDREFLIFRRAKLRFGYGDYIHRELEGDEVGTTFLNEGWEGRIELLQKDRGNLSGAMGVQIKHRNFEAIGAEAFVPPNTTTQYGIFFMEEYSTGAWDFQGGARLEIQDISAPTVGISRSFTGVSISGGISYLLTEEMLIGVTVHRTERAPNAEELFSNGPHLATLAFELGDPALGEETATGFEVSLRKRYSRLTGSASFFYTSYKNFILEDFTGTFIEGLEVAQFMAIDVEFYGGEVEVLFEAIDKSGFRLNFDGVIDFVRAKVSVRSTPLPPIPPFT